MIEASVKVASKRNLPSGCSDAEQETFTAELFADGCVVQCVCNAPPANQVFDTINNGDIISITGPFKSIKSAFFEGGLKTCQVTNYGCAPGPGNR